MYLVLIDYYILLVLQIKINDKHQSVQLCCFGNSISPDQCCFPNAYARSRHTIATFSIYKFVW